MNKLISMLSGYNTFIINDKLALGMGVDIPCYSGNNDLVTRFYPGQPVFIIDIVKRFAPFIGYKSVKCDKIDDMVYATVEYFDEEYGTYEVDYKIKCINDMSRCDNKNPCDIDVITLNKLKEEKYIDADQSRYIGDRKYYVVDLFRLGTLNEVQRIQIENIFKSLNHNKLHKDSSTIYYTEDEEFGLWDYLKAKPLKNI